jgi:hypothetical protein
MNSGQCGFVHGSIGYLERKLLLSKKTNFDSKGLFITIVGTYSGEGGIMKPCFVFSFLRIFGFIKSELCLSDAVTEIMILKALFRNFH